MFRRYARTMGNFVGGIENPCVALEARRSEAHAFYREKMAEGWSPLDCWRHAQEQRAARGDPVRPRFWTGQSIGRPK